MFCGPIGKTRWPPGLWLAETFSTSPLKPLNGILRNLRASKISTFSSSMCFLGRSEKQDSRPCVWLTETFSTCPLKSMKIDREQDLNVLYHVCVFGTIGKTRWPSCPLIGWNIFNFSKTAEQNSTKLDRKQDLNVIYQVCVFRANRKKRRPLIGWDIFDFSSKTAERNSTKVDTKQDLNVPYHVCVFRPLSKQKMVALAGVASRQKGGILYLGARYLVLWASCFFCFVILS